MLTNLWTCLIGLDGEGLKEITEDARIEEDMMALKVGDAAPDFTLKSSTGETQGEFKLADHRGKNVVILFYALDFTPV